MEIYSKMFNIMNNDIEKSIDDVVKDCLNIVDNCNRTCKVYSNLIYNKLVDKHIICKIINTKELGMGYEHEFVIAIYNDLRYLIDPSYKQFNGYSNNYIDILGNNGYLKVDNQVLSNYLDSIPGVNRLDKINIDDLIFYNGSKTK